MKCHQNHYSLKVMHSPVNTLIICSKYVMSRSASSIRWIMFNGNKQMHSNWGTNDSNYSYWLMFYEHDMTFIKINTNPTILPSTLIDSSTNFYFCNLCIFHAFKMRFFYPNDVVHVSDQLNYSISQEIRTQFLLCCALLWLYIDWFSHIHQAYFTGTVAI